MSIISSLIGPVTGILDKFIEVDLPDLPEFDMSTLLTVLGGMLGIGGLRSYEKTKNLTK